MHLTKENNFDLKTCTISKIDIVGQKHTHYIPFLVGMVLFLLLTLVGTLSSSAPKQNPNKKHAIFNSSRKELFLFINYSGSMHF